MDSRVNNGRISRRRADVNHRRRQGAAGQSLSSFAVSCTRNPRPACSCPGPRKRSSRRLTACRSKSPWARARRRSLRSCAAAHRLRLPRNLRRSRRSCSAPTWTAFPCRNGRGWSSRRRLTAPCMPAATTSTPPCWPGRPRLLAERRDQLAGDVVLMFQPGEEGLDGASHMIPKVCWTRPAAGLMPLTACTCSPPWNPTAGSAPSPG